MTYFNDWEPAWCRRCDRAVSADHTHLLPAAVEVLHTTVAGRGVVGRALERARQRDRLTRRMK